MSDTRDPVRWQDGTDEERELASLLAGMAPPPMPPATQAKIGAALRRPARSAWLVLGVVALAAAALLVVWQWPREPGVPDTETASPIVPEPLDGGTDVSEPAPPPTLLPIATATGIGCGLEVRLPLEAIDPGTESIAVLVRPLPPDARHSPGAVDVMRCDGDLVAEVPSALFRRAREHADVTLVYRVRPPTVACDEPYFVSTCARDALGRLSTTSAPTFAVSAAREQAYTNLGRVWTPSGELDALEADHTVIGAAVDEGFELFETRVRADQLADTSVIELTLEDGEVAWLSVATPTYSVERGFVPADELPVGEHVRGLRGPRAITARRILEDATVAELDVGWPDTYFVDDVLVRDTRPDSVRLVDPTPFDAMDEPIRVVPLRNDDCSVRAELVLDAPLPAGVGRLAIATLPAAARAGRRVTFLWRSGRPRERERDRAEELPAELIEALRATGAGIELALRVTGNPDWRPDDSTLGIEMSCDTPYHLVSRLLDASGTPTELHATGRYTRTGPACFAAGTRIATPEGERPIETLVPGAVVRTLVDGAVRDVRVRALLPRGEREVIELGLDDGAVLRVTAEHPLFDARALDFRPAGELAEGDVLLGLDGERTIVARADRGERARVFDLSVDGPHTYLAGGILAHNY